MNATILVGDVLDRLRALPDESVQSVVTSPPYWGLRDYGTGQWEGGDPACEHKPRAQQEGGSQGRNSGALRDKPSQDCKCGAVRIDRQLGLEKTPDEYIAKMVAVFREVRRVLRSDGTLWLNIGDSYATQGCAHGGREDNQNGVGAKRTHLAGGGDQNARTAPAGLKPKDLCGIPWALAKALRDPYYAGKIKSEADRIWLAAMIDGEGCMFIHKRKTGQSNGQGYERKHDTYGAGLEVANTHESIIQRCMAITGLGSICRVERETRHKNRNIPLYRWNLRSNQCREVIREVYPYLVGKQHEARLVLGCPPSGAEAEKAHASLIHLHNGRSANIDFPAPASMFEPGWYLRQDIIWSKCNPMPESVTDRCTKAHEYLFLLTKSARYYFDQDAIFEPCSPGTHARLSQDVEAQIGSERAHAGGKTNGNMKAVARSYKGSVPGRSDGPGQERRSKTVREGRKLAEAGSGIKNNESFNAACCLLVEKRNKRSVWEIATQAYSEAHFATFPEALVEPCILAGSKPVDTVLDPFAGSGTTGVVALRYHRDFVGIELNPEYARLAEKRIGSEAPMFNEVTVR